MVRIFNVHFESIQENDIYVRACKMWSSRSGKYGAYEAGLPFALPLFQIDQL